MRPELIYDPFNPIPTEENENESRFERYFALESSYMAVLGYSTNRDAGLLRNRAVFVISKLARCNNAPLVAYLAMNFFDRCMSRKNPLDYPRYKQDEIDVIALACLTIAWKMKDLNFTIPKFLAVRPDLAGISAEQLANMETSTLRELNWDIRPVTALCFVPYFCQKLESRHGFRPKSICQIIVQSQEDIWITELRPSVIAISAFLAASDHLYPGEITNFYSQILFERYFQVVQMQIGASMGHMSRLCRELRLRIEGAVPENPLIPIFSVVAGRDYRGSRDRGGTSLSAPVRPLPIAITDSQTAQDGKGKAKMLLPGTPIFGEEERDDDKWTEIYQRGVTETPRRMVAEDSEEAHFCFQLRWRTKNHDLDPIREYLSTVEGGDQLLKPKPKPKPMVKAEAEAEAEAKTETKTETASGPTDNSINHSVHKCCGCRCCCNVL